jgi:hypothetical protein
VLPDVSLVSPVDEPLEPPSELWPPLVPPVPETPEVPPCVVVDVESPEVPTVVLPEESLSVSAPSVAPEVADDGASEKQPVHTRATMRLLMRCMVELSS